MDRKSLGVLVVCFVLLMAWYPLVNRIYPPKPLPPRTNELAQASRTNTTHTASVSRPSVESAAPTPQSAAAIRGMVQSAEAEKLEVLESDLARYTFSSHGGGLKFVELKKYPETVGRKKRRSQSATNDLATLNAGAPMPVLGLLGQESIQGDGAYSLQKTATGIRAEKLLTNGLVLTKEFQLSSNYTIRTTLRYENRGTQTLSLGAREVVIGTATPMGLQDDGLLMGAFWYDGSRAQHVANTYYENRTLGCFRGTPRYEYVGGDGISNVVWAAVHNQFFTIAAVPESGAPRMITRQVDLPAPDLSDLPPGAKVITQPKGFQTGFLYADRSLNPGQVLEEKCVLFAGPKEYYTLSRLGEDMKNNLDMIMDFGPPFGFFAKALLLSMNGVNAVLGLGYGITIILITLIIKLLFWPLTAASTRSMKRMAALQPQMKAIQEKYKDDKQKMNMKVMEFMKEHKMSPLSGCFPVLLQIPVFFGFYKMLQSAIELRGARFLWASDLSQPDTVWIIPGLDFPVNPLPLLMGVTMLWQSHLTPPSPNVDPMQQKIMKYMPLMFIVFLYNFSAGLSLYWTVQNLMSILQMKVTKNTDVTAAAAPVSKVTVNWRGIGKKNKK